MDQSICIFVALLAVQVLLIGWRVFAWRSYGYPLDAKMIGVNLFTAIIAVMGIDFRNDAIDFQRQAEEIRKELRIRQQHFDIYREPKK